VTKEELIAELKAKDELIKSLQIQIEELKKLIFGSKRERFIPNIPPAQLNLFATDAIVEPVPVEKENITYERAKTKKHPGRDKLPDHLPVEEIIIEPEGDLTDTKIIGQDVTETLKYTPASLVRLRTIRYRRLQINEHGEEKILQAPPRSRPLPKIIAEASLLAHIIVAKFIDHLPFYRQIQRFKRDYDWQLSKSTVNDWFIAVCTLLEPLYEAMVRKLLESEYIQADESHIKVQDENKKGATHMGWQWVYHAPIEKIVVFQYRKGRGKNGPKEFLEYYIGFLQCDGYGVYDKIGLLPGIDLVGCHVHARRYFVKAKDAGDNRADFVLKIYQKIYKHENISRDMAPDDRKTYRLKHTKPLLEKLKTWLDEQAIIVLPKSPFGKAVKYTLGQWTKLIAVLENGNLEIDNNLIENKIRTLALGRKNYLFAGSHEAAQRIAMMYTFFATCKANEVNPYQWLKHTLDIIAEHKVNELDLLIPRKGMFDGEVVQ
jgi:transposase